MKKILTIVLALALILAMGVCALAEYPVTLTDQAGREVTIESRPEHIVSGYYISTSACIALGLSDRIAAVEAKADTRNIYALSAPELISLPNVGSAKNFNLEACLAAEPDLVILPKRLSEAAESISEFDIPVLLVNPEDDELLAQMILLIGVATETEDRATDLNAFILTQLGMCQEMLKNETPVTALVLGNSSKLTCAPNGMYQSSLLENACAVNAAADIEGTKWAEISYEQLLDEPDAALDLPRRWQMMRTVSALAKEERCAALCALHDASLALSVCDSVAVLSGGRIVCRLNMAHAEEAEVREAMHALYGDVTVIRQDGRWAILG